MPLFRFVVLLGILTIGSAGSVCAQTEKTFPTDEEITLLLTQTERAVQQYKPLIDEEDALMGKEAAEAADGMARARALIAALETTLKALKTKPQAFNGLSGFAFFEWLDDGSRNALECSAAASGLTTSAVIDGNKNKAMSLMNLAQACANASTLMYTVSENAGALYQKYVEAEDDLLGKTYQAFGACTEQMKKSQPQKSR